MVLNNIYEPMTLKATNICLKVKSPVFNENILILKLLIILLSKIFLKKTKTCHFSLLLTEFFSLLQWLHGLNLWKNLETQYRLTNSTWNVMLRVIHFLLSIGKKIMKLSRMMQVTESLQIITEHLSFMISSSLIRASIHVLLLILLTPHL